RTRSSRGPSTSWTCATRRRSIDGPAAPPGRRGPGDGLLPCAGGRGHAPAGLAPAHAYGGRRRPHRGPVDDRLAGQALLREPADLPGQQLPSRAPSRPLLGPLDGGGGAAPSVAAVAGRPGAPLQRRRAADAGLRRLVLPR